MQLVTLTAMHRTSVDELESTGTTAAQIGSGAGEAHVYTLRIEPGGRIGPHVAGFSQLLIPLEGSGWAAGQDGIEFPLEVGQAAYFARGELHSKGSETGMTALMIQVKSLALRTEPR
jgi:quercetin dioxygenase-like cupin family protein